MNFFSELQRITRAYCEINGLPVAKSLLCSDQELERIKDMVAPQPHVNSGECSLISPDQAAQATGESRQAGYKVACAAPPISAPCTAKEWREYGKKFPNW